MAMSDVIPRTHDYETRRTQAVPHHTLFGTTLETHSREELERMKRFDLDELRRKEKTAASSRYKSYNCEMPEHLTGSITGQRDKLDSMQKRLREQQERATGASKGLKSLEEMYKYFKVDDVSRSFDYNSPERADALRGVSSDPVNQMNNGRNPGHRYGLHSSVTATPFHVHDRDPADRDLHPNPVFLHPVTSHGATIRRDIVSDNALRRDKGPPRLMPRPTYIEHDMYANDKLVALPDSLADSHGRYLPANIQHKFTTRLCESLFCDPCLVDDAAPREDQTPKGQGGSEGRMKVNRVRPEADYHSLGHMLRYNFGHIYEPQFDKGVTQSDFNSSVHVRSIPMTDQHRCKKDDINKWAEQDVIRSRTTKVWDERQAQRKEAKAVAQ